VDGHLLKKSRRLQPRRRQAHHQDLVGGRSMITPDMIAAYVRGPQRSQVYPGVLHREHGRTQARRILADAHVSGHAGDSQGRSEVGVIPSAPAAPPAAAKA